MSKITKRALEDSLKKLLREKPFNKITIQDITDDCGISRAAFYYHFHDIYDLVDWVFLEDFGNAFDNRASSLSWDEGLLLVLEEVYKDKDFIYNVYRFIDHKSIQKYLYEKTYESLCLLAEEKFCYIKTSQQNKHHVADFYKYGFVGTILDWLDNGMSESAEDVVKKLSMFLNKSFEYSLRQISQN